jgi:uncharacterized protein YjbJ (UPF0337 family)
MIDTEHTGRRPHDTLRPIIGERDARDRARGMIWDRIEADWDRFRHAAKRRWDRLGEQQLQAIKGRRFLLAARIREIYGITATEAERQIGDWQARLQPADAQAPRQP